MAKGGAIPDRSRRTRRIVVGGVAVAVAIAAAAYLQTWFPRKLGAVESTDPQIRTSRVRMELVAPSAVGERLAAFAAMSNLVYKRSQTCEPGWEVAYATQEALEEMEAKAEARFADDETYLTDEGWRRIETAGWPGLDREAASEEGLCYEVWSDAGGQTAVLVFRGTDGGGGALDDWTANLGGVWRLLAHKVGRTVTDQYLYAERDAEIIVSELEERGFETILTAGHSLGGGLAQATLYELPTRVRQAFTFNPSPVTNYTLKEEAKRREACKAPWPGSVEARVYRVFSRQEVLALARLILKGAVRISRHIHEIRFAEIKGLPGTQHSIDKLAEYLRQAAVGASESGSEPWYAGPADQTSVLESEQRAAYSSERSVCPE